MWAQIRIISMKACLLSHFNENLNLLEWHVVSRIIFLLSEWSYKEKEFIEKYVPFPFHSSCLSGFHFLFRIGLMTKE